MLLARGDIVLTRFPFTDLSGSAVRPALVLSPGRIGNDVILCAVSSVVRGPVIATDILLESTHPEYARTGLRVTSVIRLHKLVTVEFGMIARRLGKIGPLLDHEVAQALRTLLGL